MRFRPFFFLLFALLLTTGTGCKKARGRPKVVVSIFPIYDLVRRVAGPDADVTLLVPPGRSEHTLALSQTEREAAADARLGVMVGLGLDGWLEALLAESAPKARLLKVGDRVPTLTARDEAFTDEALRAAMTKAIGAGDDLDRVDPHVWLDPQRARLIVKAIGEELARTDSAHATAYRRRASDVDASLEALDKEVEQATTALKNRSFVTFHPSFGYFAERYKLTIAGVVEPVPGTAPPPEYTTALVASLSAKPAPIFREPQSDAAPAQAIATNVHAALGVLDPVGGSPETDTYEKLIRYDLTQLAAAHR